MGLIKAAMGAAGGVMADQWKEFFYCDSMDKDVMVKKGQKRVSGRSSNTKGSDNIITNGSGIAVADGQCMIIVEQGKIVEVCAEPGQFTFDSSTEPSIFTGSLGSSIEATFATIGKRFTYGGDTGKDQRVYYFNTKELIDNKFGTPNPIPFRVVDSKIGLDVDVAVRCSGVYSYRIADPLLFYSNVCGNVEDEYRREELESQLKTEFISALQPAFGKLSDLELRPNQIVTHNTELENAMNESLSAKWGQLRGLQVVSIALGSVTLPEEDAEMIKQAQRTAIMRDPTMAAATMVGAQADAMKAAASNEAGAMTGFMGMGMAMNAGGGGMNPQNLFAMGQQQEEARRQEEAQKKAQEEEIRRQVEERLRAEAAQQQAAAAAAAPVTTPAADTWTCSCGNVVSGKFCPECGSKKPEPKPAEGWKCACGNIATGKFCPECGAPKPAEEKPAEPEGWTCSCGTVNQGKFCMNCGAKKPADAPLYRCDKCGWTPEDPKNPPRFCPECGDPFNESDIQ
ncbi:MAG: SPFH domain-containing protein [Blautia sp.]|nr:SPFH domain-containing protein [Blautia sp.]